MPSKRLLAVAVFILAFAFASVLFGQEPSKQVPKYDIAHAVSVITDPGWRTDSQGAVHMVCRVAVIHDDGTIFKDVPYDVVLVHPDDDYEYLDAVRQSYNKCRDFLVQVAAEKRAYARVVKKNTVNAKEVKQ